jgi:hypothetical protein
MQHGRDHDNRQQHLHKERYTNVPPDLDEEPDRGSAASGPEGGSRPAPTLRAAEREAERHRLERELGRYAAGEGGLRHDERADEVSRAELDDAAREADAHVKK